MHAGGKVWNTSQHFGDTDQVESGNQKMAILIVIMIGSSMEYDYIYYIFNILNK